MRAKRLRFFCFLIWIQEPFFHLETISFSNEHTKNNGFSLFKRSLKGGACPVAKAQHQNLISLTDLVKSSLTLLPVPSLQEVPTASVVWELQETGFQMQNTQSREHRVCMQLSVPRQGIIKLQGYQTDHHSIFLSSAPFGAPISSHGMGRDVWREQEFTSVAYREIMWRHPLQRGKELLVPVTPRFPSKHSQNPVCHQALEQTQPLRKRKKKAIPKYLQSLAYILPSKETHFH